MKLSLPTYFLIGWLCLSFLIPPHISGAVAGQQQEPCEVIPSREPIPFEVEQEEEEQTEIEQSGNGEVSEQEMEEEAQTIVVADDSPYGLDGKKIFNPDPTRAVWLSALFPGLGQIYNRRYWKLPIVVGGFMGLAYATSWNNNQYTDYSNAFRDLTDSDPNSKSYMDFFPPNTNEADLDMNWLTSVMRSRKNFYRRNRDLCIICMVGLYLICMIDAYVDASMAHFDISPDLSLDLTPSMLINPGDRRVSMGLTWAFTF